MESTITTITFPYFLTDRERYNLLDCFRVRIMDELRFFFFDEEDPALNQNLCVKWCDISKNGVWIAKKKVKIYIRHSRKNLRHYIRCVVSKGVFRTCLNIHGGVFLRKQLTAFGHYFCKSAPLYMFDWVLNRPMVLTDNHSISLILKLLRQKKIRLLACRI